MSFDPQAPSTVWTTDGRVRCRVPRGHIVAFGALGVGFLVGGALSPAAGRLLLWLAAASMLAVAARDAFAGPTIETSEAGITVVRTWRPELLPWAQIEAIRPYVHKRRGAVRALELDVGDTLVLVAARRLGAELDEVVEALRAVRARQRS